MNQRNPDQNPIRHHDRAGEFLRESDDFKDRLEKLGIFTGGGFKQSHSLASRGTNSLNLHMNRPNIRPAPPPSSCDNDDCDEEEDGDDDCDFDGDDDDSNDDSVDYGGEDDDFRLKLRRSSAEMSRLELAKAHENLCRKSAQILLSPLVLNNSADNNSLKLNHSKIFFTLEEKPYNDGDGEVDDDDGNDSGGDDEDDDERYLPKDREEQKQGEHELEGSVASFSRVGLKFPPLGARKSVSKKQRSMLISPSRPKNNSMSVQPHRRQGIASKGSGSRHEYKHPLTTKGSRSRNEYEHPKHQHEAGETLFHPGEQGSASYQRKLHTSKPQGRPRKFSPTDGMPNLEVGEKHEYSGDKVDRDGVSREDVGSEKADALQLAHVPDHVQCKELLAVCDYKPRNLSQKYRPKMFQEVVGQSLVTRALSNAIIKEKIAPVYLFQGSRGTGKTTAARIFASALVCASSSSSSLHVKKPCGACRDCIDVAMGKCSEVKEVDAASNNGIERVKALLEETIFTPPRSRYKVFIIDECHVLTSETWSALLKILEEPPVNVVFLLVTTDPDQLPRTTVSRCQNFSFPKIKEADIVKRLEEISGMEKLEVDSDTLQLIASRSDGSLRDAETILDQLSLLDQQINPSTLYELVGSASDEKMLNLLDCALRSDTVNTVRRVRELIDSGVEPLSLMARLAAIITDILAGSFKFTEKQRHGFFSKVSDEKLEWLRTAMKTLSEAEKQVRVSNDKRTWLTAALLQLSPAPLDGGSCTTFHASCTGTSVTQSPVPLNYLNMENAEFESTLTSRQTWFDEDDDEKEREDDDDDDLNTKFETAPINNILPSQGFHKALMRSGTKRYSAAHDAILDQIESCPQWNQSESALSLSHGIVRSPLKTKIQFIDQSTSSWPNRSYSISRDTDMLEEAATLDPGDVMKKSYDNKAQISRKEKMVRVGSLPSSKPNSPDDRVVSSRFMTHHAGEALEAGHNAVPHKRNKLKEAAGSFARFFKGSKASQT